MPYVLKHKKTSQIFTAIMKNAYDLPFYGAKAWNTLEEAEDERAAFLDEQKVSRDEQANWEPWHIDEQQQKIFNVELNNNPKKRLFVDEKGKSFTKSADKERDE